MKKRNTLAAACAILGCLAVGNVSPARAAEVGAAAPAFTLPDTQGGTQSLEAQKGRYVVLEWTNPGCPFVRAHYDSGAMQALQKECADQGVTWFTISSSAPGKQGHDSAKAWNERLQKEKAAPKALLLDEEGKVGRAYGAKTTPHMFVIDPKGVLIYAGAIDDRATVKAAEVAGAKNYVRAALEASKAGKPVEPAETRAYGCGIKY